MSRLSAHTAQFIQPAVPVGDTVDSATEAFKLTPSATELGPTPDGGIVRVSLTPSAAESVDFVDASVTPLHFFFTVTESPGNTADVGTASIKFTPSGTEFQSTFPFEEIGTLYLFLTPSALEEGNVYIDIGSLHLLLAPGGTEHFCRLKVEFIGSLDGRWIGNEIARYNYSFTGGRWSAELIGTGEGFAC